MDNNDNNSFEDHEKAVMFIYCVTECELPQWANGSMYVALATLMGWPLTRAVEAIEKAEKEGLVTSTDAYDKPGTEIVQ